MSIRTPISVKSITDTNTSGTTNYDFYLPDDTDNITCKVYTGATFTGTNPTLDVYFMTTDDGGATWYDMGAIPQQTAAVTKTNALWAYFGVVGNPKRTQGASVLDIGSAPTSTTTAGRYTGLPLLSKLVRVAIKYGGTQVANTGVEVRVYANSQSTRP